MRGADWFLTRPSIHLRKFGERWIDLFLGTVKCCVMPDLRWWHYEYEPGYAEPSRNLAEQRRDTFRGDETLAAEAAFVVVQNALHAELVSWGALGSTDWSTSRDRISQPSNPSGPTLERTTVTSVYVNSTTPSR